MRSAGGERLTRPALRQSPAFQGAAARCRASASFHPAQGPDAECEARGEVISASLLPPNPWREPTSAAAVHVRSDSGAWRITRRVARSGEQLVQGRSADGLDQVSFDPRLTREFPARVLTVSRQRNQPQVLQLRMLRELPGDVVTAHVRQIEVYKQDRGHELDSESKRRPAGVRDARIAIH